MDFASLVKQKHADADRLTDLNTRIDELIRELVKIHLVLNPAAADADTDYTTGQAAPTAAAMSPGSGAAGDEGAGVIAAARPDAGGQHDVLTAMQLSAELGAGRLVPFWSAEEDMENLLLSIQPGEVKVRWELLHTCGGIAEHIQGLLAATATQQRPSMDDPCHCHLIKGCIAPCCCVVLLPVL